MTPAVDAPVDVRTSMRHRWYQGADGVVFEHRRKAGKRHDCATGVEPAEDYLAVWSPGWFTADLVGQLHAEMDLRADEGIAYDEAAALAAENGYAFDPATRTWEKIAP